MECKEAAAGRNWREDDNYLVIHDLYSPAAAPFDQAVRELATHLATWTRVITIPAEGLRKIKSMIGLRGTQAGVSAAQAMVGVSRADSIYLCRNWQFGSELLLNSYRNAEKICYGDGIGIYSGRRAPAKATSRPSGADDVVRRLARTWKRTLQRAAARWLFGAATTELDPIEFDVGYLADIESSAMNGSPSMPTHFVDPIWPRRILDLWSRVEVSGISALREAIRGRSCVVLLGESLSESGATTLASEVALYGDIVRQLNPPPGALLLYKPHPRDNPHKVHLVAAHLAELAGNVRTLNNDAMPFLPFELLFASVLHEPWNRGTAQIWTGGYTAMALRHLFGVSVIYGFGEELIRRRFIPSHVGQRIELERYMRQQLLPMDDSPSAAA